MFERTYFLYDGDELVCELNSSGSLTAVNDFGADGVWARHTTTTDWFYTFDPQGCLSQKIGRDGSVLCSSIYDAQGHEATNDTHPDPFSGYSGQWGYYADWETSTTGGGSCLYLLGHRFYDPDAGRFLTRDPIGYDGGINLYAYTGNDPVNRADPSGLAQIIVVGTGIIPDHVYLKVDCAGRGSAGFYPEKNHPFGGAPGTIEQPDDHQGDGHSVATNTDPNFSNRLCHCIRNSQAHPPEYNANPLAPGNLLPPGSPGQTYVCFTWADDMWDCATKSKGGPYLGPGY